MSSPLIVCLIFAQLILSPFPSTTNVLFTCHTFMLSPLTRLVFLCHCVAPSKLLSKFFLFLCYFYFCFCSPFSNYCVVLIVYVFTYFFLCIFFKSIQHFYRFFDVCDYVSVFGTCFYFSILIFLFLFSKFCIICLILKFWFLFLQLLQVNSWSFNESNMKPLKKYILMHFF